MDRLYNEAIPRRTDHAKGHLAAIVLGHETNTQRCTDYAVHHIWAWDRLLERFLQELLAVRPEDVQRVAQTYLGGSPITAVIATQDALSRAGL